MLLDPKYLENFSIEKSCTIPSDWYYEEKIFEIEKRNIFLKSWHLIGSESKIPNTGDTFISQVVDQPILFTRQKDKSIKAFYNVCQHRGGPLLRENCSIKSFQCKYHGWTYKIDGELKSTREFQGVKDFNKQDYNLKSIKLKCWMGLIFINLNNKIHSSDLKTEEIEKRIYPSDISKYKYHSRISYHIKCNWKTYVDNYLEGYHIPFVHPKLNNLIDYKSYKTELYDNYSLQWAPIDPGSSPYKKNERSIDKAYYFTIFPNILLNIAPGRLQTNIIEPVSAKTCLVHFDYYFESLSQKSLKKDFDFSEEIQQEDIQICEEVQKGLESLGYDQGRISFQSEKGLHHFQSILKRNLSNG